MLITIWVSPNTIINIRKSVNFTLPTIVEIAILLRKFRAPILLVGYLVK